jgi:hypothetical protein
MKTLARSIVVACLLTGLAGTVATVTAQRVVVDVRIGTPGFHHRYYRHSHRHHRQYERPHVRHYGRPVIVWMHSYRRSTVMRPWLRAHRLHRYRNH